MYIKPNAQACKVLFSGALGLLTALIGPLATAEPLPGTSPLTEEGDFAARMVSGIDEYLMRQIESASERRIAHWDRDTSSHEAYKQSVEPNRERFKGIIGAVDQRQPPAMEKVATMTEPALVAVGPGYLVWRVRWPIFEGVNGEGLLLEPEQAPKARIVALPDSDWTPEMLTGLSSGVDKRVQYARKLAEQGCQVLVPVLIDREDTWSGNPRIRMTNQPHREFIYRGAFELGRHIIGYEVQKVLAAADWFETQGDTPIGIIGYGEGGLIAMYAAASDTRIDAAVVSGYFRNREKVWNEPIYRNVWALLEQFGDAEIASLIAPRPLVIEAAEHPEVSGPPPERDGRSGAAPGEIVTPSFDEVAAEAARARELVAGLDSMLQVVEPEAGHPGSLDTLDAFLDALEVPHNLRDPHEAPKATGPLPDPDARMKRQFEQLVEYNQHLMRASEFTRQEFWAKADDSSLEAWQESTEWYRDYFWEEVIGKLPAPDIPVNPRSRQVYDEPSYKGYQVMLDVYPDVFAYGILLVPKGIPEGERRPVVVCQHGLEGRPRDVADPGFVHDAYSQYGCRLAEQGYVVFAPQNPYIGEDDFRVLQRKANPLKLSLFSVIVRQHERILEWLGTLPFVDPERIGFYGLSYGGKTAMRVPAILPGYCLSICSADFNEWIWKNVSVRHKYSYMFTKEYEMFEFNLANTFNYAEMSWLILPRPFMVERGHFDGVAPDKWVAYEYARTRFRYDVFGIGERTEIEFFTGPHSIHGVGTFEFLHRHLGRPESATRTTDAAD